jgi:alpha-1,3-rhamnosyl/mannosyltransferase
MHVLFDARLLHRPLSGIERVQRNVLRELAGREEVRRLRAAVARGTPRPPDLPARIELVEVAGTEDLVRLLLAEPEQQPDVYHLSWFPDRNPHDLWLPLLAKASVVEVHDAILNRHPEYHPDQAAWRWYDGFVRLLLAGCDRILVHSESVAGEAVQDLGAQRARIDVANLGVDPSLAQAPAAAEVQSRLRAFGVSGDYFVIVGKDYPHKDHRTAFRALARVRDAGYGASIVCAGSRVWQRPGETSAEALAQLELQGRVRWIDNADDEGVQALLLGSRGLVYPSREEGFGLPPIEAMALGVPVLASAAMSIPEVCGDGAWLFPPGDDRALAQRMRDALTDRDAVARLVERGRRRVQRFSWQRCAEDTLRCYDNAIEASASRPRLAADVCARLQSAAAYPFDQGKDLAAWRERCLAAERTLDELRRRLDLPAPEVPQRPTAPGEDLRPRWSLKRRLKKIRDGLFRSDRGR